MAAEEHSGLPLLPDQGTDHLDENIDGMPRIVEDNEDPADTLITPATLTNPAVTSASPEAIAHQVVAANEQRAANMMGEETHENVIADIAGVAGRTEPLPGAGIIDQSDQPTVPHIPTFDAVPLDNTTLPVSIPPAKGEEPGDPRRFEQDATNAGLANEPKVNQAPPPEDQ